MLSQYFLLSSLRQASSLYFFCLTLSILFLCPHSSLANSVEKLELIDVKYGVFTSEHLRGSDPHTIVALGSQEKGEIDLKYRYTYLNYSSDGNNNGESSCNGSISYEFPKEIILSDKSNLNLSADVTAEFYNGNAIYDYVWVTVENHYIKSLVKEIYPSGIYGRGESNRMEEVKPIRKSETLYPININWNASLPALFEPEDSKPYWQYEIKVKVSHDQLVIKEINIVATYQLFTEPEEEIEDPGISEGNEQSKEFEFGNTENGYFSFYTHYTKIRDANGEKIIRSKYVKCGIGSEFEVYNDYDKELAQNYPNIENLEFRIRDKSGKWYKTNKVESITPFVHQIKKEGIYDHFGIVTVKDFKNRIPHISVNNGKWRVVEEPNKPPVVFETPTTTMKPEGTTYEFEYNPLTRATTIWVFEGRVLIIPKNKNLLPLSIEESEKVTVYDSKISNIGEFNPYGFQDIEIITQIDDGPDPSSWRLKDIPHGLTYEQGDVPKEYIFHKVNSSGGEVDVKKWIKDAPQCYQTVKYRWKFDKDISQINQGEKIAVVISSEIVSQNVCSYVRYWNRYIKLYGANGGQSGGSKYLPEVSHESRYLIWGESERIFPNKGEYRAYLDVTDKTAIGVEKNARDGFFKISLNGEYDIVYLYEASAGTGISETTQSGSPGWRLDGTPHGVTYKPGGISKSYDFKKLDGLGGLVEVKQWVEGAEQCYQTIEYKWSFNKDVSGICEDDIISVNVSSKVLSQNVCSYVRYWNRWIRMYGANGGQSGGSKYVPNLSHESRYLTWGESRRLHANAGESQEANIQFTDKTNIGVKMNAPDGFFKFTLNGEYDVVYKYIQDAQGCNRP